jgi:hypothetical protein
VAVTVCAGSGGGLTDELRRCAAEISDEQVGRVIAGTLEHKPPQGDTRWSIRPMATTMDVHGRDVAVGELVDLARVWAQAAPGADMEDHWLACGRT